jgi:hypothetical protein
MVAGSLQTHFLYPVVETTHEVSRGHPFGKADPHELSTGSLGLQEKTSPLVAVEFSHRASKSVLQTHRKSCSLTVDPA